MRIRHFLLPAVLALVTAFPVEADGWKFVLTRPAPRSTARDEAAWAGRLALDAARSEMRRAQYAALRGNPLNEEAVRLGAEVAEATARATSRKQELAAATWRSPEYAAAKAAVDERERALVAAHADPKSTIDPAVSATQLMQRRAALRAIEHKALQTDDDYRAARAQAAAAAERLRGVETQIAAAAALDPAFLAARHRMIAARQDLASAGDVASVSR